MADSEAKNFCGVERTLVVFKPDAVQRGIVGELLQRFERVGLKIVGMKMVKPDKEHYYGHYETIGQLATRRGETTLNITLEMMMEGPVIAMVLEGEARALAAAGAGADAPDGAAAGPVGLVEAARDGDGELVAEVERQLAAGRAAADVVVVTSDRELAERVGALGASVSANGMDL